MIPLLGGQAMYRSALASLFALFAVLPASLPASTDSNKAYDIGRPPGQRIDVGGYKLHINCLGERANAPVVVLDAGVGGFSLEWTPVQEALAKHTKVCAYDRAGYGWSDMGPLPRTTARISGELHELLHGAGLKPPYILIGHSFGGYSIQHFARTYSDEVAGLVFVESSHPEQLERLPSKERKPRQTTIPGGRSVYIMQQARLHPNYPEGKEALALELLRSWKTSLTVREEMLSFSLSARQVRQAGSLPHVPVVVLTRGLRVWPHTEHGDALETTWMQLQDELAHLTPGAIHLIAEHSGHSIHMDEPGVVVTAVNTMMNRMDGNAVAGR